MTKNEKKTTDKNLQEKPVTAGNIFLKATLLSLLFTIVLLLITAFFTIIWGFGKLNTFAKTADTSISELKEVVTVGLNTPVVHSDQKKNILVLGVDSLDTRPGSPALTDTIILLSIDLPTGKVSTISFPRDLWSPEYQTRINALYHYGKDRYPEKPEKFAKETIEELTGIKIHHTVVLSLDSVAEAINILGGIEIDVPEGFIDEEFPRSDVDVTVERDPAKLYKTVEFEEGLQHMKGEKVLEYIRSRKSENDQGTDIARSERQQLVINSLIQRLKNLDVLKNVETLGELYKYYSQNYEQQIPLTQLIATIKELLPVKNDISLSGNSLSIYPDDKFGVITNPPLYKYNGQWVYEVTNDDKFKEEIYEKLNGN